MSVVKELLGRGAAVFAVGRQTEVLEALERAHPGVCIGHRADLLEPEARAELLDRATGAMGPLTGVVLAAGAIEHAPFAELGARSWERQLALNLQAPTQLLQRAGQTLSSGASVVIVGSTLAQRPIGTSAAYSAAKAGLEAIVKLAAVELAPSGIRVNLVHPGVVDTPMIDAQRPGSSTPAEVREALAALHPMGRIGSPSELARVILDVMGWTFATGSIVTVDGGLSARP
jgi:NAD(P)-dependent dehydrogenase (short-subunit alcohol dehydrogenase family)